MLPKSAVFFMCDFPPRKNMVLFWCTLHMKLHYNFIAGAGLFFDVM